ncbi:MAG: diguanylate cyclase [Symploca sp. SIO1C2]|nr:diguanylate cyclase [Symploca sp. SIO1C2]
MIKILIVEDESVVAWDIQETLEQLGYKVVANVTSGAEAIQIPAAIKPDLVLMDIQLEDEMDGITAAGKIRDRFDIPIIYLTAHADEYTWQRAISTNPYGYLVKPFQERELQTTIEIALRRHQVEKRSQEIKEQMITSLISIGEATIVTDHRGRILSMNQAAESLTDWSLPEVLGIDAQQILTFIQAQTHTQIKNPLMQSLHKGIEVKLSSNYLLKTKNGKEIPINSTATPIKSNHGEVIGSMLVFQDISEQQQAQKIQQQSEQQEKLVAAFSQSLRQPLKLEKILNMTVTQMRQLLENDQVVIYRFSADGSGSVVAESVASDLLCLLGWEGRDPWIADPNYLSQYSSGQIRVIEDTYKADLKQGQLRFLEFFSIRSKVVVPLLTGKHLWGLLICHHCSVPRQWSQWQIESLKQLANQIGAAIEKAELVQKLDQANQQLQYLASMDSLTQLANRSWFENYLDWEWKRLAQEKSPLAIIVADIDFFQELNDTHSNQVRDNCLRQVASAIRQAVEQPTDLVARYSEQEFGVILPNTNASGGVWIAQKMRGIVKRLKLANCSSPVKRYITLSLGVASIVPTPESDSKILVEAADKALCKAKTEGGDRVVLDKFSKKLGTFLSNK